MEDRLIEFDKMIKLDYDFELVLFSAFRYALGRQTYIVGVIIDYIKSVLPALSSNTLTLMKKEIKEAHNLGSKIDEEDWMNLYEIIAAEISDRENCVKVKYV